MDLLASKACPPTGHETQNETKLPAEVQVLRKTRTAPAPSHYYAPHPTFRIRTSIKATNTHTRTQTHMCRMLVFPAKTETVAERKSKADDNGDDDHDEGGRYKDDD